MRKSAVRRIRLGMLLHDRAVHRAQLGASRLEVDARREPAEELCHPVHAPVHHRGRQVMRAGDDVRHDFRLRRDRAPTAPARRRSSPERSPSRIVLPMTDGSLIERRRPEAVRQHRGARGLRTVVGRPEQAAHHGSRPMTSKYEPPTTPARTTRGSPRPTIVNSIVGEVAERGQRLDARSASR